MNKFLALHEASLEFIWLRSKIQHTPMISMECFGKIFNHSLGMGLSPIGRSGNQLDLMTIWMEKGMIFLFLEMGNMHSIFLFVKMIFMRFNVMCEYI